MIAGKEKKVKRVIPGKIKTQLRLDGYYNVLNKYGTQHDRPSITSGQPVQL